MELPNKSDWLVWQDIEDKFLEIMFDQPIINVLPILIILEEMASASRPPSRLEIQKSIYGNSDIDSRNWWQLVIPDKPIVEETGKNKIRKLTSANEEVNLSNSSEHNLYQLMQERGLISSLSFKEAKLKGFGSSGNARFAQSQEFNLHGRERLYSLTPLGKIFLNILVLKSWYSISLNRNAVKRGFLTISTVSWVYLYKIISNDFFVKPNFENLLTKKQIDVFWKMQSPITRIIVEYRDLMAKYQSLNNLRNHINIFLPGVDNFSSEELVAEEFCILISSYFKIIEAKASSIGIDRVTLLAQIKLLDKSMKERSELKTK